MLYFQVKHPKKTNRMIPSSGVIVGARPIKVFAFLPFLTLLVALISCLRRLLARLLFQRPNLSRWDRPGHSEIV